MAAVFGETLELMPTLRAGESTGLTLELAAIKRKGTLFEQLFGLTPVLNCEVIMRS